MLPAKMHEDARIGFPYADPPRNHHRVEVFEKPASLFGDRKRFGGPIRERENAVAAPVFDAIHDLDGRLNGRPEHFTPTLPIGPNLSRELGMPGAQLGGGLVERTTGVEFVVPCARANVG